MKSQKQDTFTPNQIVNAISSLLIKDDAKDLEIVSNDLDISKLDYSLESLKQVDLFLSKVRKKLKILTDEQFTKIIIRCGAYSGEVIRKNSKIKFDWMIYADVAKTNNILVDFEESPLTYYILTSNKGEDLTFPMAKVEKFLSNGFQDSLHFYARVIGKF